VHFRVAVFENSCPASQSCFVGPEERIGDVLEGLTANSINKKKASNVSAADYVFSFIDDPLAMFRAQASIDFLCLVRSHLVLWFWSVIIVRLSKRHIDNKVKVQKQKMKIPFVDLKQYLSIKKKLMPSIMSLWILLYRRQICSRPLKIVLRIISEVSTVSASAGRMAFVAKAREWEWVMK
jgi:hypothetical protein